MGGHDAGRRLTRDAGLAHGSRGAGDSGHSKLVGAKIVNKFPFVILRIAVDDLDGLVGVVARHARDASAAEDRRAGLSRSGGARLLRRIGGRVGRGTQHIRDLRRAGTRSRKRADSNARAPGRGRSAKRG